MSAVLDFFRQQEPRFQQVPDADLAKFIGDNHPEFLRDPEFNAQFGGSLAPAAPAGLSFLSSNPADVRRMDEQFAAGQRRNELAQAAARQQQIEEAYADQPMAQVLKPIGRSGKVALAATADLATLYPGGPPPSVENLTRFANQPDQPLPIEELIPETSGFGRVSAVAGAAGAKMLPVLGQSILLGAAGAPAAAAAGLPMGVTEQGGFDPVGAAIAAGLPGVTRAGEKFVARGLEQLPTSKVVLEVLSKDPLRLKGKVVQRIGGLEFSNDAFRKYLEAGGGMLAANAYLLATQTPGIMALPPEQRSEAILDAVAGNLAPSVLGFVSRQGPSLTLEGMYPRLMQEWARANEPVPRRPLGQPAEEGAPVPEPGPIGYNPFPEAPATVQAQAGLAADPNSPKSTVLVTPGEPTPAVPGLVPVPTAQGTALVNPQKADPAAVATQINAGGGGTELGMSTPAKPPGGNIVVQTHAPDGTVIQDELATPATVPQAQAAGEALMPGATTVVKSPEKVLQGRAQPGHQIADYTVETLLKGGSLTPAQIRDLGAKLGLDERQSGEWAELGATEAARTIAQTPDLTDREKFHALVNLYERMPTNAARTVETKVNQQYSTPPPLAWVGSVLADFKGGLRFLEPTAGHGMLMIGANSKGALLLNEMEAQRRERLVRFLKGHKGSIGEYDATALDFVKRAMGAVPDRVGQNPPFGNVLDPATNKSKEFPIINAATKAKTTTSIDLAIALNTFEAMTPQGKGFAIIGAKTGTPFGGTFGTEKQRAEEYRRPVMMEFFERFNVVDWFTLGGDLYRKMGAAWPVDMIIVHGKGKTPSAQAGGMVRPWVKPPRVIESWEELAKLIPEQTNENLPTANARQQAAIELATREWMQHFGDNAVEAYNLVLDKERRGEPLTPDEQKLKRLALDVINKRAKEIYEHENIPTRPGAGQTGGSLGGTRPSPPVGTGSTAGPREPAVSPERPQRPPGQLRPGGGNPSPPPAPSPNPTPAPSPVSPGDSSTGIGTGTPQPPQPVAQGGTEGGKPATPGVGGKGPVAAGSGKTDAKQPVVTGRAGSPLPAAGAHGVTRPTVPVEGLPASLMVPFQSVSKGPSLNLVAPRNIATQMQAAALELERQVGMPIDDYVAGKLGRDVKTLHTQLAGAQVDTAALAIRDIERGSALICAHETGVGKGRVVAALIEYARMRGLIPVFVTAKPNLFEDMIARDLPALGNKDFKAFITNAKYAFEDAHGKEVKGSGTAASRNAEMEAILRTGNLPGGAQGVFTTYDQLKSDKPAGWSEDPKAKFKRKGGRDGKNARPRPDGPRFAMLRALAPRAIFILDESHLAAGPTSEVNLSLSTILPQARGIYYSSATYAKRPDNLGIYALGTLMSRTGLNHQQMTEALHKGGVPLQQALTSMLAESGELIRAQQDWKGVEMTFESTATDPAAVAREVEAADTYTSFIRDLITLNKQINAVGAALEDGENQVRADEEQVRLQDVNPMARLFNLSNQYLFALRAEAVAKRAVAELKAGRKPFIHVHNTLEGPLLDLRARKLPLNFNGILLREMQKMLKLTIRDPMAEGGKREVELTPEDLPDGGAFYRRVEQQINATDLSEFPISPIDHIKKRIQAAGYSMGEITARDGQVEDSGEEIIITKREKAARNKILKSYNDGQLDVLLINGSGGTGLSAHTDPRFKDQRQRSYLEGQPAPDINDEMQAMGRTMRSGQTSKPKYIFPSTALAAERRFATMLRGKMTSLNANTTAEGESGMTQQEGFAEDIFNQVGDDVVFRVMQANPVEANLMELGTGKEDAEVTDGFARQATGRFVLLPNADAQRLWDEIIAEYKDEIQRLDEEGQNPLRATAEDLRARTVESQELVAASGDTLFDGAVSLEKTIVRPPKAPPTHEAAIQRARDNMPPTRQRVQEWVEKSRAAERDRVAAAEARGQTPEQIDRIRANMQAVREAITEAYRKLGDTFGVDKLGDGSSSFYGVAAELKLSDKQLSDYSSLSRQELILTTNTFTGRYRIPLSKLFRNGEEQPLLNLLDEDAAAEQFNTTAESNAERHIITGNLLRGWEAADQATSGREMGRPRVAIYTREDGSLNTGILMPPGWTPGEAAAPQQVITTKEEFVSALNDGASLRSLPTSSVHPVVVELGGIVKVPSSGQGKLLWGDPDFSHFFDAQPVQREGAFFGKLRDASPRGAQSIPRQFFDWLTSKGVRLINKPSESAAMRAPGGGGGAASRGAFVSGVPRTPGKVPPTVQFGGMQFVRPLQLPELTRIVRELTGEVPKVRKIASRGKMQTLGQFGDGMISLDPRIFKDPEVAGKVLAHELGHLADYLPHETLRRGNLLGHLLALNGWLRQTFGPLNNRELRNELLNVTMWWRPYDPTTDPKSYVAYRESPEELYADALSVLFNAPAELETRAPKFYQAFWENLGKRPEVETALFAVQDLLNKGMLPTAAEREAKIEAAFAEGEQRWKQAVADRERAARSWDGWWTRLAQELYWNFYPLEQRARAIEKAGGKLPFERDPRVFLDDLGFRDVTVMKWGRMMFEKVIKPIEDAGLTLEDAGKLLLYQRILTGDRSGLANPGGLTPEAARLGLLKMNLELGLPKLTLLRAALDRFHDEIFKLTEQAVQVGAYNRTTFESVIKPNRGSYATFAVLDYVDDWIPPGIKQQIGTLKDVANPFHATILKSIGLINLIAYQQAKNKTVEFLQQFYPADLERAGDTHPTARKGKGTFMRLENGRPAYYYTDPYIADAFDKLNPRQLWWLARAADGIFRKFVYPLIITYNPAFLYIMSPLRDVQRTARNLPGAVPPVRLGADYVRNLRETLQRYHGNAGPLIREMEANLALGTPFDLLQRGHRDDFLADLLKRMRVLPDHELQGWFASNVWRPVRFLLDRLELGGMTLDTLAKTASYQHLRRGGLSPRQAAMHVRNFSGLPNINKKGLIVRQMRALIPFWNVAMQGWRADFGRATNPTTAAGWWFKYMATNGLLRAFLALAATGALGAALKELFDGIGENDKTNYLSLPLGTVPGGDYGRRTAYLRIPEDETARLLGGLISKGIRQLGPDSPDLAGMFDFGMGQIPSLNPALSVPAKWAEFAAGHSPRDPFTGRDIVPDLNWKAGGWDSLQPMAAWTLNQSGVMNFFRYNPDFQSGWELALSATPGVNKFLKVSDQGKREQQQRLDRAEEQIKAREKLALPATALSLSLEYGRLDNLKPDLRTPQQSERLLELNLWHKYYYLPAWEGLERARENGSTAEADAIRRQLERDSIAFQRRR